MKLKSRPLFLIVSTLCILLLAVASYGLALLPQRGLSALKADLLRDSGLVLDASSAHMDFSDGIHIVLDNVSLAGRDATPFSMTARSITVPSWFNDDLVVDQAVIDVDLGQLDGVAKALPKQLTLHDSTFKFRDRKRQALIAITDVNGTVSADGENGLKGSFRMLWDNQVSDLSFSVDDRTRLSDSGSPADVSLSRKEHSLALSGRMKLASALELDGQLLGRSDNLHLFAKWLGMPISLLSEDAKVEMSAGLSMKGLAANFSKLTFNAGNTTVTGDAELAAGADRARLSGIWAVNTIDLLTAPSANYLAAPWSEKPLPVQDLLALDADVQINAQSLGLGALRTGPAALTFKMQAGVLNLRAARVPVAEGTADLELKLGADRAGLLLDTKFNLKSTKAQALLNSLLGFAALDGPLDATGELTSTGVHAAGLVSTLKGKLNLKTPQAILKGVDPLPVMAAAAQGWSKDATKDSALNFSLDMVLEEGVARLDRSDAALGSISFKPKGEIDLLRQALSLTLSPKGQINGNPLPATLKMEGPWVLPQFATGN